TDTGDDLSSGDWRLWLGYPNADRPWTRLIACTDCMERKTYSAPDPVFQTNALGPGGALKGEFLQFRNLSSFFGGRLRMTGYEQDTFGSDDVGEVYTSIGLGLPFPVVSTCEVQDETLADKIVNSGCAAYNGHIGVEPGQTRVSAVLSPEVKAFLNKLLVGKPSMTKVRPRVDSDLFAGPVTARVALLTSHREVEGERWQETFKPGAMSREIAVSKDPDKYVKDLRRRVLHVLGPRPTPKQRAKVAADLRALKPSIPAALYQKHLCDLETGRPCAPALK